MNRHTLFAKLQREGMSQVKNRLQVFIIYRNIQQNIQSVVVGVFCFVLGFWGFFLSFLVFCFLNLKRNRNRTKSKSKITGMEIWRERSIQN